MPEGDTIHRLAAGLAPALVGRTLVRIEVRPSGPGARRTGPGRPAPGTAVTAVEAQGKHLLVRFADGHVLRTHLGMTGRWDVYPPGGRWRRPAHLARAVVEVAGTGDAPGVVAVCFAAPVVELARAPAGATASAPVPGVAHLGPDLCRPDADLDAVLARMATIPGPDTAVAEVLLDQRVAAGVGNVYKSEVLWACRVHPLTPIGRIDEPTRQTLVATAADLLRRNLAPGRRTTVDVPGAGRSGALAVYGRARRLCRRCAAPIEWARTGPNGRSTFWCPRCQPAPPADETDDHRNSAGDRGPAG